MELSLFFFFPPNIFIKKCIHCKTDVLLQSCSSIQKHLNSATLVRTGNLQTPSHLEVLIKITVPLEGTEGSPESIKSLFKWEKSESKNKSDKVTFIISNHSIEKKKKRGTEDEIC